MNDKLLVNLIKDEKFDIVSDVIMAGISMAYPLVGPLALATKGLSKIIISRTNAYKKSLDSDLVDKLEELSKNEIFLQKFLLTIQSAVKSHNDDKAAAFAKLLNGTYEENVGVDEVFEYTELLNKLSINDMFLLNSLETMPQGKNLREEDFRLELQEWKNDLTNKSKHDLDFLESYYLKLQGYGLCKKWSHSSFMGQRFSEFWQPTSYYRKFLSYLDDERHI